MSRRTRKKVIEQEYEQDTKTGHYNIRKLIKFKNEAQKEAYDIISGHRITFLCGPAGTAKSFLCISNALDAYYKGEIGKIVLTRPMVEAAGEKMGFLPGTLEEKIHPYLIPLFDMLGNFISEKEIQYHLTQKTIEICPLAFMRGRSQPLYSEVKTINGFKKMGDIKPEDFILGKNGKEIKVKEIFPQGNIDIYQIQFSDGSTTQCSLDHLWLTKTRSEKRHKKGFSVKTTKNILETLKVGKNQCNHEIPICNPIEYSEKEYEIDPYVLGCFLGDAYIGDFITFTSIDQDIVDKISIKLEKNEAFLKLKKGSKIDYQVNSNLIGKNKVVRFMKENNISFCKSWEKFIPEEYLMGSVEQRLELLRGLLDTDGCIFKNNTSSKSKSRTQYYSTSEKMADQVRELVFSLGGTCTKLKRNFNDEQKKQGKGHNRSIFVLNIILPKELNPFYCRRKAEQWNPPIPVKLIKSIEYVGKTECQCILVDSEDHLYLTDYYIVTHNTLKDCFVVADEMQNANYDQIKMLTSRIGEGTKMVLTGDSMQSDLRTNCCFDSIAEGLSKLDFVGYFKFGREHIVRDPIIGELLDKLDEIKNGW